VETVGDPDIPGAVPDDRGRPPLGRAADGTESAVLEVGDAAKRRHPQASAIIFEEGPDAIIGKPFVDAIRRDLAAVPSAQAVKRPDPHAAIPGREDGPWRGTRQSLIRGHRSDRAIAKAIEAVLRRDPDAAFTILEEPGDEIARQAVRLRVDIRSTLVHMQETAIQGADPQTTVAIPQQPLRLESGSVVRKGIL